MMANVRVERPQGDSASDLSTFFKKYSKWKNRTDLAVLSNTLVMRLTV